jgi:hypothetical protein
VRQLRSRGLTLRRPSCSLSHNHFARKIRSRPGLVSKIDKSRDGPASAGVPCSRRQRFECGFRSNRHLVICSNQVPSDGREG